VVGRDLAFAVCALLFVAAPTAGDIGSCGQAADDLDATKFFADKSSIDRAKCDSCSFETSVCDAARRGVVSTTAFPAGCYPLVHDGEVCLDALLATGCGDYRAYVADDPSRPTECNFCPPRDAGGALGQDR
jgi:hypothetical protein